MPGCRDYTVPNPNNGLEGTLHSKRPPGATEHDHHRQQPDPWQPGSLLPPAHCLGHARHGGRRHPVDRPVGDAQSSGREATPSTRLWRRPWPPASWNPPPTTLWAARWPSSFTTGPVASVKLRGRPGLGPPEGHHRPLPGKLGRDTPRVFSALPFPGVISALLAMLYPIRRHVIWAGGGERPPLSPAGASPPTSFSSAPWPMPTAWPTCACTPIPPASSCPTAARPNSVPCSSRKTWPAPCP